MRWLGKAAAIVLAAAVAAAAGPALAAERGVYLVDNQGLEIRVATVAIEGETYRVDWDDAKFGDYFLSMRPFKCLEGPEKLWCRVPYPYEIRRNLAGGDLTDLEYDLMFIWKRAGEYGINMWNGVYYQLEDTGAAYEGVLHEMDMDLLSAPPDAGVLRPIGEYDTEAGEPESHWLPRVIVR